MNNLLVEVENKVAIITINRPKVLNVLNRETMAELSACFTEITQRDDIKVVILTGAGEKAFAAGGDLHEMANATPDEAREMSMNAHEILFKIENCPKAVIAAVNGFAIGGGCELSMACDIRIAAENAKFGLPEASLGITPGYGGSQRLPRLIGKGRAKELIYTADIIDAQEAYRIGLVNKVVPKEKLLDCCREMAAKIAGNGRFAIALSKQAINAGMETDLSGGLQLESNLFGRAFSTKDKKEGITAFFEKRKAVFSD